MTVMTAEQAFNVSMNEYPSLYTANSVKQAKMKYFDHIFNVIGNGYRDLEEFIEGHTINSENEKFIDGFPQKYIGKTPLFYAYTEVEERGGFKMGLSHSSLPGIYTKEELENMPNVIHTVRANGRRMLDDSKGFVPYPNFNKQYSMVWKMDMEQLDASWKEAAVFYYKEVKKFFESDNVQFYSSAIPKNEVDKEIMIEDYENAFKRYRVEGMSDKDFHSKISKEYEMEYTGDTLDFINRRWEKELNRINQFIDETLEKLEQSLTKKVSRKI